MSGVESDDLSLDKITSLWRLKEKSQLHPACSNASFLTSTFCYERFRLNPETPSASNPIHLVISYERLLSICYSILNCVRSVLHLGHFRPELAQHDPPPAFSNDKRTTDRLLLRR